MPYKSGKDLPKKQFDQYSSHGRNAAAKAFDSALKEYGDESTAFAVAHHAASQADASKQHPKHK